MAPRTKGRKASTSPRKSIPSTSKIKKNYPLVAPLWRAPGSSSNRFIGPTLDLQPGTIFYSTTMTDPTRPASPSSQVADDTTFSTTDTLTSVAARTPTVTAPPSSAATPRPTPTNTKSKDLRPINEELAHELIAKSGSLFYGSRIINAFPCFCLLKGSNMNNSTHVRLRSFEHLRGASANTKLNGPWFDCRK